MFASCACMLAALCYVTFRADAKVPRVARALVLGVLYILVSTSMIESNKWLMSAEHFPYPFVLAASHMLASTVLANGLRLACPSCFPALQHLKVTPRLCARFALIAVPFVTSIACGNSAYKYLSVSFLQIMKQSNIVTIYALSLLAGLEAPRRCSLWLLLLVLAGASLAVEGELHFQARGFLLQAASSLSEAAKVVAQSVLMAGEHRLDALTMVLFMAPACLLADLAPLALLEGPRAAEILQRLHGLWPLILGNAAMAFALNAIVAQCIKELSAVGFLLCGILKDILIIGASAWLLGESLSPLQLVGFSLALAGVALYSLYKQHADAFEDDGLFAGFSRIAARACEKRAGDIGKATGGNPAAR